MALKFTASPQLLPLPYTGRNSRDTGASFVSTPAHSPQAGTTSRTLVTTSRTLVTTNLFFCFLYDKLVCHGIHNDDEREYDGDQNRIRE